MPFRPRSAELPVTCDANLPLTQKTVPGLPTFRGPATQNPRTCDATPSDLRHKTPFNYVEFPLSLHRIRLAMAKDRFEIKDKTSGLLTEALVVVDKETGVNYLFFHRGYGGGLTPLLDSDGKPIITKDGYKK